MLRHKVTGEFFAPKRCATTNEPRSDCSELELPQKTTVKMAEKVDKSGRSPEWPASDFFKSVIRCLPDQNENCARPNQKTMRRHKAQKLTQNQNNPF